MHAGFSLQPAKGVVTFKVNRGAFDAGHVAVGGFEQLGFKAMHLAPAQVRAQDYLRNFVIWNPAIERNSTTGNHTSVMCSTINCTLRRPLNSFTSSR
jgi:hypothetical protein